MDKSDGTFHFHHVMGPTTLIASLSFGGKGPETHAPSPHAIRALRHPAVKHGYRITRVPCKLHVKK